MKPEEFKIVYTCLAAEGGQQELMVDVFIPSEIPAKLIYLCIFLCYSIILFDSICLIKSLNFSFEAGKVPNES